MRIVIVITLVITFVSSAGAADIYKCKGAKGELIYQNMPCPNGAKPIATGHYDQVPDDPRQEAAAAQEADRIHGTRQAPQAATPARTGYAQQDSPAGYSCSAGARTWIQAMPCPASAFDPRPGYVSAYDSNSGRFVSGAGTIVDDVPVQQQALSRSELCRMADEKKQVAQYGLSGPKSAYERNKMRTAGACH